MSKRVLITFFSACLALAAPDVQAQNISLNGGNADLMWHGPAANANAGIWMDQGAVGTDGRADLIIGAPGNGSVVGRVYVIYGGPNRSGHLSLSSADAVITGAAAGDLFGAQTAAGNILTTESSGSPRDLLVAAPDAQGGRGVVYLFRGGFGTSAALTTTNAVYRVVGAPGDHLGRALATADVNNDGFRELVIGAVNKVYIIRGASTLTGTKNLETSAADQLIGGVGIGSTMVAGDVTGDNITDLVVASSTLSGVYLYRGQAGGLLSSSPDANYDGVKPSDRAGESLRLGDIDSDGKRDIIIGAPGADGPDETRTDSGAVYVLWGGGNLESRLLANADVTFYGEVAGYQLGASVTSGDVNRDTPNDLVMLAPGGSSLAGDLVIYYGASARNSYGVVGPNGRRVVDFAAGGSDRKIFGDPAVGPIRNAQVFEVTGEGARDIIAAVPSSGSNAGQIYFTVSPRMRLGASSFTGRVIEEGNATTNVEVRNVSEIGITWTATSNRPWIVVTPASGSSVSAGQGAINIQVIGGTALPGTYTGQVTVRSTSDHLEMSLNIPVTLVVRRRSVWPSDFTGDTRADPAVYRPSTGTWYVPGLGPIVWGVSTDIPVRGDFDGDGLADVAVYRKSTGGWYIRTPAGGMVSKIFGGSMDTPVPADYDGDGRTDIAVFRPSANSWFIHFSSVDNGQQFLWGGQGDVPVPADYDGDGRSDIAVFRPSTGMWYIRNSTTGALSQLQWGGPGDIAVPGDYDGDRRADIAIYRPSDGKWYIVGFSAPIQWGGATDEPVPGDYDGDVRADIAVFRRSTGEWFIINSSNGAGVYFVWGGGNDIPLLKR